MFNRETGIFSLKEDKLNRFEECYYELKEALETLGVSVSEGKAFNSGYHGFTFSANNKVVYVFEQPGVVGLENHRVGYIKLQINDIDLHKTIIEHKDRLFGDVDLNKEELEIGYTKVRQEIQNIFSTILN